MNVPFSHPSEVCPQKDGRKVRSRWKGTFTFRRAVGGRPDATGAVRVRCRAAVSSPDFYQGRRQLAEILRAPRRVDPDRKKMVPTHSSHRPLFALEPQNHAGLHCTYDRRAP